MFNRWWRWLSNVVLLFITVFSVYLATIKTCFVLGTLHTLRNFRKCKNLHHLSGLYTTNLYTGRICWPVCVFFSFVFSPSSTQSSLHDHTDIIRQVVFWTRETKKKPRCLWVSRARAQRSLKWDKFVPSCVIFVEKSTWIGPDRRCRSEVQVKYDGYVVLC